MELFSNTFQSLENAKCPFSFSILKLMYPKPFWTLLRDMQSFIWGRMDFAKKPFPPKYEEIFFGKVGLLFMGKVKVLIVAAFMRKLISVFLAEDSRGKSSGLPGMEEMSLTK
ncbi:hypothetical protein ABH916_001594 [Peribacillus frigoritolerans]